MPRTPTEQALHAVRQTRYRLRHPRANAKWCKSYRAKRPGESAAASRLYQQNHKEETRARAKTYHANNAESIAIKRHARYLNRREIEIEQAKRRAKEKPEIHTAAQARREARKRGNGVGDFQIALKFRRRVMTSRRIRCYWCHGWVAKENRQIDHILPISKGGPDAEWNLCCSCAQCNSRKHAKDPGVFSGQYELNLLPIGKGGYG